jgi:chloramphenicol-sensitive protein RarD
MVFPGVERAQPNVLGSRAEAQCWDDQRARYAKLALDRLNLLVSASRMESDVQVDASQTETTRGLFALLSAFATWGVLPLYLRWMREVPPLQITMYRLVFCCLFVVGFLHARGAQGELYAALRNRSVRMRLIASSALISINWLVYVWAVSNSHVVESSLGYFINPLVNVLLGVLVLGERLRRVQWFSVSLAVLGVVYLTWQAHAAPWIALLLAITFGSYGLLRKTVAVDAMAGRGAETLLAAPIGLSYLVYCELHGTGWLFAGAAGTRILLVLSGLVTALPLWLFSYGARRVAYSTVGIVQYIGPTLQLLVGVLVFHEAFPMARLLGFALIWSALLVYALDGVRQRRAQKQPA